MNEKTEILDYIRQLQMRRESKQKTAGYTLWALWGALTYLLLESVGIAANLSDVKIQAYCASLILLTAVIYLALPNGRANFIEEDDPRFMLDWKYPANTFWGVISLSFPSLFPALLLAISSSWRQVSVIIPFIGWVLTMLVFYIAQVSTRKQKFPFPAIRSQPSLILQILFNAPFLYVAYIQVDKLHLFRGDFLKANEIKAILLTLLIYWILYFIVKHISSNISSQWLDQLEGDLVFDLITPSDALATLERETLGRKISSILADHWTSITADLDRIKFETDGALVKVQEILQIPPKFKNEIQSQRDELVTPLLDALEGIVKEHGEYVNYLKKLKFNVNKVLIRVITSELNKALNFNEQLTARKNSINEEIAKPISVHLRWPGSGLAL